jgi:hypothetical protein
MRLAEGQIFEHRSRSFGAVTFKISATSTRPRSAQADTQCSNDCSGSAAMSGV